MGFPRQEYWSGLAISSWPRDWSRVSCIAGRFFVTQPPGKPSLKGQMNIKQLITQGSESHSVVSDSLRPHGLSSPWNSPGQNTGVGSHSLFQGIFPTQGSNPGLPHCRQILYQLSHQGSPRILECVAYPFSSESSWPRNWTGVSCIAGRFFTSWATRKGPNYTSNSFQLSATGEVDAILREQVACPVPAVLCRSPNSQDLRRYLYLERRAPKRWLS